jgi:hypothetical protein
VCPYQDIDYSVVITEGWSSDVIQNLTFYHQGSGNVQHWIMSGLNNNKNYSLSVIVGESEASAMFGEPSNII